MVKTADRRKVLAVLAGGLVLGVGTAVTLAAWNDSEFATGDFAAGTFVFQGSTDNETFEDHTSKRAQRHSPSKRAPTTSHPATPCTRRTRCG